MDEDSDEDSVMPKLWHRRARNRCRMYDVEAGDGKHEEDREAKRQRRVDDGGSCRPDDADEEEEDEEDDKPERKNYQHHGHFDSDMHSAGKRKVEDKLNHGMVEHEAEKDRKKPKHEEKKDEES